MCVLYSFSNLSIIEIEAREVPGIGFIPEAKVDLIFTSIHSRF